jgi:hypothetical protein
MDPVNEDVYVIDAEDGGSNGLAYDFHEQVIRVYDFNLDNEQRVFVLPPMTPQHRGALFKMSKKLGLSYSSMDSNNDGDVKVVTLSKPKNYAAKHWDSPFAGGAKNKGYDKLPVGAAEVIAGFLWLGSGRDADDLACGKWNADITAVLNVTSEWKEHPKVRKSPSLCCC